MSEKKRSDITLGEMRDECLRRKLNKYEVKCGGCPYDGICAPMPCNFNLTDPPRFNEAQMALLRGLYQNGAATIRDNPCDSADVVGRNGNKMAEVDHSVFRLKRSETLDLAELLGKDGAET